LKLLTPLNWTDYALLDSGNGEKLEKFGQYIISRPEPQALWDKSLSQSEWDKISNAEFKKEKSNNSEYETERGEWFLKKGMPQQWKISYKLKDKNLIFRLGLTSFKHVGIFPEQAENWEYIFNTITSSKNKETNIKVLNLFAYTGGASLAAKAAGADVVHVDSVKQVINWSRENMELSGLNNIRWVIEDALKFVRREAKRGNKYSGIILDPPAYGRGPDGEKWILEQSLNELLKYCAEILEDSNSFLILNMYSLGHSALILENLIYTIFGKGLKPETGELYLQDNYSKKLPLGVFCRFSKQA
jgi:23S rRNA (cytosine1962-C5)-methyltransferase